MNLQLVKRPDGWWITGLDADLGPYATKPEAEDDRRGVERFYRHELVSAEAEADLPPVQHLGVSVP
jgi:hypothetical protein